MTRHDWLTFHRTRCGGCVLCGCPMDDHNDPRQGGGCTSCGDCEGWL